MPGPPPGGTGSPLNGMAVVHALCALQEQATTGTCLGGNEGELPAAQSPSFLFINGLSLGGLWG